MNNTFELEQKHLENVHQQLSLILETTKDLLTNNSKQVRKFKKQSGHDTSLNFDSYADNLDTFASIETMNKQIDYFNSKQKQLEITKKKAEQLLPSPYFAKINLKYPDESENISFYIGSTGLSKNAEEQLVIDWRSPLADLYYNNQMGKTFYLANNFKIDVDVKLRRQFLLHDDILQNFFDTDIAIQDPLLIKTLQKNKSNQMSSITATIQKEQNLIIRDEKSSALLVNGIAGSGKTSVILQRIAYLLYKYRDTLIAEDVLLITPNSLFTSYINDVLPSLGESSPSQMTFDQLLQNFGNGENFKNKHSHLKTINNTLDDLILNIHDFKPLKKENKIIFSADKILELFNKTSKKLPLTKRINALTELLIQNMTEKIQLDSRNPDIQNDLDNLSESEQVKIFGKSISSATDNELTKNTKKMLNWQYRNVIKNIRQKKWLNLSQIIDDILGKSEHNALDFSFIKLKLFNLAKNNIKFVMIDEVQDYTLDEIYFLITALPKAHWTLVGDEFQSIKDTGSTQIFKDLVKIFERKNISIKQRNLYTSYRSSGYITKAFTSFGTKDLLENIKIIQDNGEKPTYLSIEPEKLLSSLKKQLITFKPDELSAIITTNLKKAEKLAADLNIQLLKSDSILPKAGTVVLPLITAKGLEFDNVMVINDDNNYYDHSRLGSNRMYTALSRASKKLFINTVS
ncbi:HelD family protein [Companilactobacillus baiquanensis]|uniref:HelD family protein n=1 Tax=Companilactobacillus baiquanensis TaxID=2486005 RepID=A0ABW1UY40_9LACO|nr:AAA family ATPase [Companilactobacillus baiquanensis]